MLLNIKDGLELNKKKELYKILELYKKTYLNYKKRTKKQYFETENLVRTDINLYDPICLSFLSTFLYLSYL